MAKNLLDLNGKQLEQELDRIAKENPPRYIPWTEKELHILKRLKEKGVQAKKIAEILGKTTASVENKSKRP